MTTRTRLLSLLGCLVLVLVVMVSPAKAQRVPPPARPTGPTHPGVVSTHSAHITIAQSGTGLATDSAIIKLEGPSAVQPGQEFSVSVMVTGADNLYGLQLELFVDLAKFKIMAVTPGALFGQQAIYQVGPTIAADGARLSYAVTLVGNTTTAFNGDGLLATLTIKTLSDVGQTTQVWSGASILLGNPDAQQLSASVTAAPLVIGTPIVGRALSLDQPIEALRVALVERSSGYEIQVVYTDQQGDFTLVSPGDGHYLIRANDVPFLPAAIELTVTDQVPSLVQFQMDLIYGDWDGDGVITLVDLDRFATLYYGYELYPQEAWIDIYQQGSSLNYFDLRDLYYVAFNNGLTTPPQINVGWVKGKISNFTSGLAGAAIDVRTAEGAFVETFTADSIGFYTFSLEPGTYRLTYDAAGHEPLTRTITINPLSYREVFVTLPPASIALANPIQIDLQWLAVGDMDSWLLVPGAISFETNQTKTVVSGVGNQGQSSAHPHAVHLGDVVDSSGTESIIIYRLLPGVYEFWTQKAVGDLNLSMNVQVAISGGTHQAQTVSLVNSTGDGYLWLAFRLTVAMNGDYVIEAVNTLHDAPELLSTMSGASTLESKRE